MDQTWNPPRGNSGSGCSALPPHVRGSGLSRLHERVELLVERIGTLVGEAEVRLAAVTISVPEKNEKYTPPDGPVCSPAMASLNTALDRLSGIADNFETLLKRLDV